jgi:hypothetical protein
MKLVLSFFLLSGLLLAGCKGKGIKDPLDYPLSANAVKKDFMLFKDILQAAHPSLALYKSHKKIDFLFDSINTSFSGSATLRDFYSRLYFISNEIGCSHTDIFLPGDIYDTLQNRKFFFPYPVLWIENKLLINATGYDLPEGTQIISVNGIPVKQILNELSVYNTIDGFHRPAQLSMAAKDFAFQYYLKWGPREIFDVKLKDTLGLNKNISMEPITYGEWNQRNSYSKYYFDAMDVDYDLTINNEKGYALLRLPTFEFDGYQKQTAFEHFCANSFELLEKKKNITRLIIDIRENTGGNLNGVFLLFSYLAKKAFNEFECVASKINRLPYSDFLDPDFASREKTSLAEALQDEFNKKRNGYYYYADSLIEKWSPDKHRFNGQVIVITNAATVSAASYFAILVKKTGVGKIIGDETAGSSYSGNGFKTLEYVLPQSRFKLMFPYAHMIYSFKEDKNTGRGVIPDYIVPDTYDSFKKNEDKQVGYIIDSLFLN